MAATGSSQQRAAVIAAILAGCAFIAPQTMQREGYSATPYRDIGGVWTVCNGDTKNVDPKKIYTDSECRARFMQQIVQHGSEIADCLPAELPVQTRGAFTDMAYNIGSPAFCKSSMSRLAKAGDLKGACAAISLYVYAGGKDCRIASSNCRGIVERRTWERRVCEEGLS